MVIEEACYIILLVIDGAVNLIQLSGFKSLSHLKEIRFSLISGGIITSTFSLSAVWMSVGSELFVV